MIVSICKTLIKFNSHGSVTMGIDKIVSYCAVAVLRVLVV